MKAIPPLLFPVEVFLTSILVASSLSAAAPIFPPPPLPGEFVADEADALDEETAAEISDVAQKLFEETGKPVLFVTVPSLEAQGAKRSDGWTAEAYGRALFLEWSTAAGRAGPTAGDASSPEDGEAPTHGSSGATASKGASVVHRAAFAARGLLVLSLIEDERLVVMTGSRWVLRELYARRFRKRYERGLGDGGHDAAMILAARAAERLLRTGRLSRKTDFTVALAAAAVCLVTLVTLISYFREGSESAVCRMWARLARALGAALMFLLQRGMDFGASLSRPIALEGNRGRIVTGRW